MLQDTGDRLWRFSTHVMSTPERENRWSGKCGGILKENFSMSEDGHSLAEQNKINHT